MFIYISFFSLLVVDCQLEMLEFLVIYIDVIDWQKCSFSSENLNSSLPDSLYKTLRLSQARRASEIGWLSDSFFCLVALCEILYSIYFQVNF